MSLVGQVGRKRPRARFALLLLYLGLTIGALTTLVPFLIMAGTGFKGPTDQNDNKLIPAYFSDDGLTVTDFSKPDPTLFGKYLDDKYASNVSWIKSTRIGANMSPQSIQEYRKLLQSLPLHLWEAGFRVAPGQVTSKLTLRYQAWLRTKFPSIEQLNKAYIEENVAFSTCMPPAELLDRREWRAPESPKYRDWLEFKATLPVEFRIPVRIARIWQEFLRSKGEGQIERLPAEYRNHKSFEEINDSPGGSLAAEFFTKRLPPELNKDNAEQRFWNEVEEILPIDAEERAFVAAHASEIRNEFATRNYRYVINYILLNGRAVFNTVLFCALVILAQLTVNPIAAFALSRYPIRASGKILIFLLATMAFPAEVAMIPSFLLLKDLGLLNTFAALVLPTAASGYMIFLLKGFFDSLPQELYESGQIDGAKEHTMLWKIALPLSRPVLGYLALLAFMGAYGAFLFAFLICQDRSMWTLMVSLYQLQLTAPKAVVMAALTLAAIPTLTVFLLAQRVIMRGIVLPGER